jgi:subtilisin family serine protease
VRVPLVFPAVAANRAAVYAFIGTQPGDDLRVAVEQGDGTPVLPFVARGETRSASNGVADATLVHHMPSDYGVSDTERGIALILSGSFRAGEVFSVLLEGDAVAELWLQSEGDLAPEAGRGHVVFPAATRERTVTIPASSPRLISVGATLNRTTWPSFGQRAELFAFDDELDFTEGTVMTFSSAGPNLRGRLKPELVAPGGVIVGALSRDAAPLVDGHTNPASMFGLTPLCPEPGCAQVDDQHAVAVGTSMAAPLVTGAVALLLEHDPTLTQDQIRSLLMTGASRAGEGFRAGAGQLDIEQSFRALALGDTDPKPASPGHSWLSFAQSFVHPSDTESVWAWLHLRDVAGNVTTVASDALDVRVQHGRLAKAPVQSAPGLVELQLAVDSGQAGERLEVSARVDGEPLTRASLPIAVDSSAYQRGSSARGGCAVAGRATRPTRSPLYLLCCVVCWVAARRRPRTNPRTAG